jgi:predicted permease
MNLILKQFLIIGAIFLIILWFQYQDDKKNRRERKTFYDKYKFPLLVSSIIGLLLNLPAIFRIENKIETLTEITIVSPVQNCDEMS